jgi:hypothetical protein
VGALRRIMIWGQPWPKKKKKSYYLKIRSMAQVVEFLPSKSKALSSYETPLLQKNKKFSKI